jgi:hypothetical protein
LTHGCPVERKWQPKRVYLELIFYFIVILGLDPRIQGAFKAALGGPWIAGSSPAMTIKVEISGSVHNLESLTGHSWA